MTPTDARIALALALALDALHGEPPNALHPVAWLGSLIGAIDRRVPRSRPRTELVYGAALALAAVATAVAPAMALSMVRQRLSPSALSGDTRLVPSSWRWAAAFALLLKPAFAGRALLQAAETVRRPLAADDLDAARVALRALVSRSSADLDAGLLAAAAVESLAENASDSFAAPLFYYSLFGLPGAWAYRAANTLDAMVGYHGHYESLGKIPARLDDALNLIPARLTGLLIVIAAGLVGHDARGAWRVLRRDHARTESPNAGHPMSAMAGALGVRLEKVGHYQLNVEGRASRPDDIARAERIVVVACVLSALGALASARAPEGARWWLIQPHQGVKRKLSVRNLV